MTGAGKFTPRRFLICDDSVTAPIVASAVSIVGPREGVNFAVAPDWDGYTSTTTERPPVPAPEPSRQVRRAEARRHRKAVRR